MKRDKAQSELNALIKRAETDKQMLDEEIQALNKKMDKEKAIKKYIYGKFEQQDQLQEIYEKLIVSESEKLEAQKAKTKGYLNGETVNPMISAE